MYKLSLFFSFMATTGMVALFSVLIYAYAEPPPLVYTRVPFPMVTTELQPGDRIKFEIARCNIADYSLSYDVYKIMLPVNAKGMAYLLPPRPVPSVKPGCANVVSSANIVPDDAESGVYYLSGVSIVRGRFREHRIEWKTEQFVIP